MGDMSPRKSPKSPFSGNAGPENPRSPFRGAGIPGNGLRAVREALRLRLHRVVIALACLGVFF